MKRTIICVLLLANIFCFSQEKLTSKATTDSLHTYSCEDSDISVTFQADVLSTESYPKYSSLMDSLMLKGSGLYNEIRVMVLAFNLYANDEQGNRNDSCLQCYNSAKSWGSITGGSLPGFTGIISNYPDSTTTPEMSNLREMVFQAKDASKIDKLPMTLNFLLPGANPDGFYPLHAEIYLKFTFRNLECEEYEIIFPVSATLSGSPAPFARLNDKLDCTYFPAFKGKVKFKYEEPYQLLPGKCLDYVVYDKMHNPVTNKDPQGNVIKALPNVSIKSGSNYLQIDLSDIEAMKKNEFYTLEIINVKREKSYLRFLFLE